MHLSLKGRIGVGNQAAPEGECAPWKATQLHLSCLDQVKEVLGEQETQLHRFGLTWLSGMTRGVL